MNFSEDPKDRERFSNFLKSQKQENPIVLEPIPNANRNCKQCNGMGKIRIFNEQTKAMDVVDCPKCNKNKSNLFTLHKRESPRIMIKR
jgi:hypothetical protein